jgi:hypothetical protein
MSGWGKLDSSRITGNVTVTNGSRFVTNALANATTFLTDVKPGDYFAFGQMTANTNAKYQIAAVANNISFTLTTPFNGTTASGLANIQQGPKFVTAVSNAFSNTYSIQRIVGIDAVEANIGGNKANGFVSPGWTSFMRYTNSQGNVRIKTEVLVAMSKNFNRTISANGNPNVLLTDANDDAIIRNS